jgi:cation diffusion facilitator family transporter
MCVPRCQRGGYGHKMRLTIFKLKLFEVCETKSLSLPESTRMPKALTPQQQVERVFLITLVLNLLVAVGKIFVGIGSGALSITADGFHSLTDGSSNVLALIANRIAHRPADEDHPYGHQRFETLGALAIGTLLLLTAWEVVRGALERLQTGEGFEVSPLLFVVLISTLVINLFVSRYQIREGKRLNSELLLADAANTSSDVFVTLSVIVSMALVALFGWVWVDTVAALVVVVMIARAGFKILRQTGSVLVDTAPYTPERLTEIVLSIPSVGQVVRARSRGTPDAAQIDIDLRVPPETTAEQTAVLTDVIRQRLEQELKGIAEIEVHFIPNGNGERDYNALAKVHAHTLGLDVHAVRLTPNTNGKTLEMHVEVPPRETLAEAHMRVSQLEEKLQSALPEIGEILTHIEPAYIDTLPTPEAQSLIDSGLKLLNETYPGVGWHHAHVYSQGSGCVLMLHASMPPNITVDAAHHIAESAVTLLRAHLPQLERVTIHTEPPEDGSD